MAEITQHDIEDWILNKATGTFKYTDVMDRQIAPKLHPQLRAVMWRLKEKGVCVPVSGRDGYWRAVDKSMEEVAWWDSDGNIPDNVYLPLGIHKLCLIPKPSLIIVSGKYNSGKTAYAINCVNQNIDLWKDKINFFVSEGAEMMGKKFGVLTKEIPMPPPFKMYRRLDNFADVIEPDYLNIIDYLRVDMSKPYEVSDKLYAIFKKLRQGIAIVMMQKPQGDRKLAFGGGSTAFEPSLYMGMDDGWLGFEKVKVPKILNYSIYDLKIKFKISQGVKFVDVHKEIDGTIQEEPIEPEQAQLEVDDDQVPF
jgi:hypothetical protein